MSRPERSTRRRLAVLAVAGFVLGIAGAPGVADAQTDDAGAQPDTDQFGGYIATARGNALQITYDSPGLLATGSPVVQFSIPEALANLNSGPVGYSLASFLFPGPLIADLDAALAAGGTATGIPPYPIRSEAFFPSGPQSASQGEQGTEMVATTEFADSRARASYAGLSLGPAGFIGGMAASSQSAIDGDQVVSRARSEVADISIAGGLVSIDSVVTDLVATSNGESAASAGGTKVTGLRILGLPATLDENGISFEAPPEDEDDANPVDDGLGGVLGPVLDPVTGALDDTLGGALNDLLDQVDAVGEDALQQLFEATGIEIELLESVETIEGGTVTRSSAGISVTLNYDGKNTPVLTDLLELLPTADLPSESLGPIPFSPQALVLLLEKVHTVSVVVGVGDVSAKATPAFTFEPPVFEAPQTAAPVTPPSSGGSGGISSPGDFTASTPNLPPASGGAVAPQLPVSSESSFPFGDAIPALFFLGLVLGSPFLASGSSRLADNALAATVTSCPDGLDRPPTQEAGP